jgi:hypothetical protein
MAQVYDFDLQGLQPAHSPRQAVRRAVKLPRGGPTDSGGSYARGAGLGNVGGTAQPEIWTISTTLADNTFTFHFVEGLHVKKTAALAYNVSTANLKTALETIFGEGAIATVTGTPGTEYVITFTDDDRVGGNIYFAETASSGSISIARTQRGSCGAGQYDLYDGSGVTTIDAINEFEVHLDATGARVTEFGVATGSPFSPPAFVEGFFYADDIPNVASGAVGNDKKLGYALGSSLTAGLGTILRLSQKN